MTGMGRMPHGYQPPGRYGSTGALRHHAIGCWVNGGKGLPPGKCGKCTERIDNRFVRALMRQDKRKKVSVRD